VREKTTRGYPNVGVIKHTHVEPRVPVFALSRKLVPCALFDQLAGIFRENTHFSRLASLRMCPENHQEFHVVLVN